MTTIRQLYLDAITYEESLLAHYIFFLLQEGRVNLDDDKEKLTYKHAYSDKFLNMWKNNQLGFSKVKIYSLKQSKNRFIFIFAENKKDARDLYYIEYGQEPMNCMDLSPDELMDYGNRFLTFREIKKEMKEFPCILGYYDRPYSHLEG